MKTSTKLLQRLLSLPTKFFVDIGASNDPFESQTEMLIENGWTGIMFECDPAKFTPLMARMKNKNVIVIPRKVTPDNVIELLRSANAPRGFYLSLDIDGYDFFVLSKIISIYEPQLIISEINEKIPPPIKFTVNYDPNYSWDVSHFYGYSLSMLEDIKGYKVETLDFNNVVMTPGTQETPFADIYRDGYWNMGLSHVYGTSIESNKRPSYNADFDPIYNMPYEEQIRFIKTKFAKYAGKYTLEGLMDVSNTGQIKTESQFGQWITKYAADTRFTRYLEIGTWNGRGSTCCFYEGFKNRTDAFTLQSYEIAADRAADAKTVWSAYPAIQIIHGRMLKDYELPIWNDVCAVHSSVNVEWHTEDVKNFWGCSFVAMNDPQVILLDGAEYLTWFEFKSMIATTDATVYMLDDTNTSKCPKILGWFADHPEWERVAGSDTERNGWAIYERRMLGSSE